MGVEAQAEIVNANPFFINRVNECQLEHDRRANFLAVDFYELGDCFDVLYELNGTEDLSLRKNLASTDLIKAYPNPTSETLHIKSEKNIRLITVTNLIGEIILKIDLTDSFSNSYKLSVETLEKGIYLIQINDQTKKFVVN